VQLVTPRRGVGALILAAGLVLTACGTGNSSHVVGLTPASPNSAAGSNSEASTPSSASSPSGLATPSQSGTAAAPADAAISASTLSQVDAELGAVDDSLNQSNTDLNFNPQGDS
jgi:hypothetical protein